MSDFFIGSCSTGDVPVLPWDMGLVILLSEWYNYHLVGMLVGCSKFASGREFLSRIWVSMTQFLKWPGLISHSCGVSKATPGTVC